MILKGNPFCISVIVFRRESRPSSGYVYRQAGGRREGISLHMIDGEYIVAKIVLSFQILVSRVSPVIYGTKFAS